MRIQYDQDIRKEAKEKKSGLMTLNCIFSNDQKITLQGVYDDKTIQKVWDAVGKIVAEENEMKTKKVLKL